MKLAGTILAAAALVGAATLPAAAGPFDRELAARQGLMELQSWNIGTLGAMAKGEMAYDAEAATTAANNLVTLSKMNVPAMWPEGSDIGALEGKTWAKPEIWADMAGFQDKVKALTVAAEGMAAVAGDGLEAVQGQIKNLGGACGGCHKEYRQKQ